MAGRAARSVAMAASTGTMAAEGFPIDATSAGDSSTMAAPGAAATCLQDQPRSASGPRPSRDAFPQPTRDGDAPNGLEVAQRERARGSVGASSHLVADTTGRDVAPQSDKPTRGRETWPKRA